MQQFQKIDIDWDIYKMIESERHSFDEPPYVALRRLLKLPNAQRTQAPKSQGIQEGLPWVEDGVSVPHGSPARMRYLRGSQVYEGQFLNGKLVVGGRSFDTLSAAANALAVTKDGSKTSLNGWKYWEVILPGTAEWQSLDGMRQARR